MSITPIRERDLVEHIGKAIIVTVTSNNGQVGRYADVIRAVASTYSAAENVPGADLDEGTIAEATTIQFVNLPAFAIWWDLGKISIDASQLAPFDDITFDLIG